MIIYIAENEQVIEKILKHLGLWEVKARPPTKAKAPPVSVHTDNSDSQLPACDVPLDVFPEFTPPYVEAQTEALGLSAAEWEQLITVPMEADLLNWVAWLDVIRSEPVPGQSSIVLIFEPGTDLTGAR